MYKPDTNKLKKYLRGSGENHMDWHAWLRDLSGPEREQLTAEVLETGSRLALSDYARQYYLHYCTDTEDDMLRSIEHGFVTAQLENRLPEEIAEFEDRYFERAKELIRLREQGI